MATDLKHEDRLLLMLLQDQFPLNAVPYTDLAERLGWTESAVLERIPRYRERGLLREISAIFDTRRLGYRSTLVALQVEPGRLDAVADAIGRHPGVSHSYGRDHAFNLWFTLAVPPKADLMQEAQALAEQPGVLRMLSLPVVRTFKIDARFDLNGEGPGVGQPALLPAMPPIILAEEDIAYVRALQADLPLVQRPFWSLAVQAGLREAELLDAARRLRATGIVRRYGAILRHQQAGYTANAMVCWKLPEEAIPLAGEMVAAHWAVSHCYQRASYPPEWPYSLFAMVHARSQAQLESAVQELEDRIRPQATAVLATTREYKKERPRYFLHT